MADGPEAKRSPDGSDVVGALGEPATLDWAGRSWTLLPDGSAYRADRRTLLVADLHLGKGSVFRARGVPVPRGGSAHDLARLSRTLNATGARRLVVLGDFLHARESLSPHVLEALEDWRRAHAALEVTLVRGNHDLHAGDPPPELGIRVVEEGHPWDGLALRHVPPDPPAEEGAGAGVAVAGHLHPVVRLEAFGGGRHRRRCFWVRPDALVLPAYARFAGGHAIRPRRGHRIFVPVEDAVVEVDAR